MSIQRDVGQQNAIVRQGIMNTARSYLHNPQDDPWLTSCLLSRGLDPAGGLLVAFTHIPEQGDWYAATWLTDSGRFWELEVLAPWGGGDIEIETFEDVTDTTETSAHVRGTGKSFGCLALEVQAALRRAD